MQQGLITGDTPADRVETRGYSVVYHEDKVNHCPGCGRTHWHIGRVSAECGFCETAVPLASATSRGSGTHHSGRRVVGPFELESL